MEKGGRTAAVLEVGIDWPEGWEAGADDGEGEFDDCPDEDRCCVVCGSFSREHVMQEGGSRVERGGKEGGREGRTCLVIEVMFEHCANLDIDDESSDRRSSRSKALCKYDRKNHVGRILQCARQEHANNTKLLLPRQSQLDDHRHRHSQDRKVKEDIRCGTRIPHVYDSRHAIVVIEGLDERSDRVALEEACEEEGDGPCDDDSEEDTRPDAEGPDVEDTYVEEKDRRFGEAKAEVREHVEGELALSQCQKNPERVGLVVNAGTLS